MTRAYDACEHCGGHDGFTVKAAARGKVELYFGEDGEHLEVGYEGLEFVPYSEVVRCTTCGKIRRGFRYVGHNVVKESE
jgi:hypothetical protein